MIQWSPRLLIAAASAFVGVSEAAASQPADGGCDVPQAEDGAAFVHRWGYWSHFDHRTGRSSWPLPEPASAQALALAGAVAQVLHDAPSDGDIFLQYSVAAGQFVRAGVVAEVLGSGRVDGRVSYHHVLAIEANTDARGFLGGRDILRVERRFVPAEGDKFLRWMELDRYVKLGGRDAMIKRVIDRLRDSGPIPQRGSSTARVEAGMAAA